MKISVIGAGYVGLTTAACLAQIGHDVFCSESDVEKLEKLQSGAMPLFEPNLEAGHQPDADRRTTAIRDYDPSHRSRTSPIYLCRNSSIAEW